ncbi:MAG: tetratricopeptide repeat protein [Planctomycetota bacterium]|nr:tetratricopeptide repeat protein [Planctomycetota bacterium]
MHKPHSVALALLVIVLSPVLRDGAAQAVDEERAYFAARTLRIYCSVEETPAGLKGVDLWLTTDGGKQWKLVEGASLATEEDGSRYFEFAAPGDGEYGFKTVATDNLGHREAPPVSDERPRLVAVVDTKPPLVTLVNPKGGETVPCGGELIITWDAQDDNIGERPVATVEVSRDGGSSWELVGANERARSSIAIILPSQEISALLVRITARDLADNQVQAETEKPITVVRKTDGAQPAPGPNALPPARSNSRIFNIDYEVEVGESGLKAVVLWYTEDDGKSWKFYGYDTDLQTPIVFSAPKDGVYGFYIIAYNMADGARRPEPAPGTQPDKTTFVDSEPPSLVIASPRTCQCFAGGTQMEIAWIAQDDLLVEVPIALFYRENDDKPWTLIARVKEANGTYGWNLPFFNTKNMSVKVTVDDLGKNTTESIVGGITVDSMEIRPRIREIKPAVTPATGAGGQGQTAVENPPGKTATEMYVDVAAASAHFEKGRIFRAQQKWSEAAEQFELALKNRPDFLEAYNDLGCVLYRLRKYDGAILAFTKALELSPHDAELIYNLAAAHFSAGELPRAADLLLPLIADASSAKVGPKAAELLWSISLEFSKTQNSRAREIWKTLSEIGTFTSPYIQKAKEALGR